MKKFHDVKPRSARIEDRREPEAIEIQSFDDDFWAGRHHKEIETRHTARRITLSSKTKQAVLKASFVMLVLLFFFGFSLSRAVATKNQVEILTKNVSTSLGLAMEALNDGDLERAMALADKSEKDVIQIKLYMQSWGQDVKYLSLMSDDKSRIVNLERLMNATSLVLDGTLGLRRGLGSTFKNNMTKDVNENAEFSLDVAGNAKLISDISKESSKKLDMSESLLNQIDSLSLPEQKNNINKVKDTIAKVRQSFAQTGKILNQDFLWLSGYKSEKKNILIVFQNNGELRGGSGGSFGSFGIAKFDGGKLTGIDFGKNIYKIDHAFTENITPPDNLSYVVGDRWTLKDSGWAVDGAEAMEKMAWFYNRETGEKVDGVLIIDVTAFEKMLALVGPIDLPEYQKTISADNFRSEIEQEVHNTYFESDANKAENEPKKILAEMMPIFLNKLFSSFKDESKSLKFLTIFSDSLASKDILFAVDNKEFMADLDKGNYSGRVSGVEGEYLYVNNSNLNGFKSSLSVDERIVLDSALNKDGQVVDNVTLTREHKGTNNLPDGLNRNFVRALLPQGTKVTNFVPQQGNFQLYYDQGYKDGNPFWVGSEAGRDELNFWMNTEAGAKSIAQFSYQFDFNKAKDSSEFSYPVLFQKQPGSKPSNVTYRLKFPEGYVPENVSNYDQANRQIEFNFSLDRDKYFKINFKKIN